MLKKLMIGLALLPIIISIKNTFANENIDAWQKDTDAMEAAVLNEIYPDGNIPRDEDELVKNSQDIRLALQASCKISPDCTDAGLKSLEEGNPGVYEPDDRESDLHNGIELLRKQGMRIISSPLSHREK